MSVQSIVETILAQESEIGPAIVSELLGVLIAARQHFVDLEEWTLFLAVVSRTPVLAGGPETPPEPLPPGSGTNVRSLADSCQLPRETVRRKVRKLVDRGYLTWRGGKLLATATGRASLEPLAREVYRGVARVRIVINNASVATEDEARSPQA